MKYSIYVKNYLKKEILKNNPGLNKEEAAKKANQEFKEMLLDVFYGVALAKLSDDDCLKKLELEEERRFLDINPVIPEDETFINPYNHLYHGVRFDDEHILFESILRDRKIKSANQTELYWRADCENCNEGEYVSLIHYTGEDHDIEFKTFIEENVAFIISSKLNPLKCKYLPYDEWGEISKKLPKTKHRYSYARGEYQYPDSISFDYVKGILYPLKYYNYVNGYFKTKEDLEYIRHLLIRYGFKDLPILDPTDNFKAIEPEPIDNKVIRYIRF